MAEDNNLRILSEEEDKIRMYWDDVIKNLRSENGKIELAYIWKDEVKSDFEGMKTELERTVFILKKLYSYYRKNEKKHSEKILGIENLIQGLKRIEPQPRWIKKINAELKQVISDIEEIKDDLEGLDKKATPRRTFLRLGGRVAAGFTAASIISKSNIVSFPSIADAAESKKYLPYEELMELVKKYGYIFYSSNIKSGELPKIILFGETHVQNIKKKQFLKEFKGLVYLFEGKGMKNEFLQSLDDETVENKYFWIDTYGHDKYPRYVAERVTEALLFAFINEANEGLIKIWKDPKSAGYIFLSLLDIRPSSGYSIKELKKMLHERRSGISANIGEFEQERDDVMLKNIKGRIKEFSESQIFVMLGGNHLDTYGDMIKENDRFSLFFNQNKISYFSILEEPAINEAKYLEKISNGKFNDWIGKDVMQARSTFCQVKKCKEQLFFRLAKEK